MEPRVPRRRTMIQFNSPNSPATPLPEVELPELRPELKVAERPTVLASRQDSVSALVAELDFQAARLASKYGINNVSIELNEWFRDNVGLAVLQRFLEPVRKFVITRTAQMNWGIFHVETPSIFERHNGEREILRHISDCSLEVKRDLLRRSQELFTKYMDAVNSTIGGIDQDTSLGEAVLRSLRKVT